VEHIREEIGQEATLRVLYILNIAKQPQGGAVAYAAHHSIQPDGGEFLHKRLHADPVVAHKHHSLFAVAVHNVYHLFGQLSHLPALERLEVLKFLRGDPVAVVHITLVNNELRAELVAHLLLKLL